mgnify:CR=1 FL=1
MAFDTESHAALAALIDYAKQAGADGSEASYAARESISAEVRLGELEGMEREEARSVALRALIGKRQAARPSTINSQPSTNREVIRLPDCKSGVFKQAGSDDWSVTSTSHHFWIRSSIRGAARCLREG